MKNRSHVLSFVKILSICILIIVADSCAKSGKGKPTVFDKDFYVSDFHPESSVFAQKSSAKRSSVVNENFAVEEAMEMDNAVYNDSNFSEKGDFDIEAVSSTIDPTKDRKLIINCNLNIEVESLDGVEQTVLNFAKSYGGYVTDSSSYENSYSATIRIPSNKINDAMSAVGNFGKIKYRNLYSEDVTEQFYDLQTRLSTKKIMRSNLEKYLTQAQDIKDLLEIERQLNSVISDIESMEGRMKRLTNQIDYSTLYINMMLPMGFSEHGFIWPDLGEDLKHFGMNFVNFIEKIFVGIFYISIFGVLLIAIVAFLYWLLFGRVGLLIKLFKKLSWKKELSGTDKTQV